MIFGNGMKTSERIDKVHVGPDLVRIEGDFLVIYSRRYMADWVVREFCRPAIWFQDQKFYLHSRRSVRGSRRWKYLLSPWPESDYDSSPYAIHYSEAYVRERESQCHSEFAALSVRHVLLPLYPFLGFLWSGLKDKLGAFGFNARSITSMSIILESGAAMMLGIFMGYLGCWSFSNVAVFVLLMVDAAFRYDAVLHDRMRQPGLFEWCFRRPG